MSEIKDIEMLQRMWGYKIPDSPVINIADIKNCLTQLQGELTEIERDVINPYMEGADTDTVLKGLRDVTVDLQFFIYQLIVRSGLAQQYAGDFQKILDNNMSKVHHSEEEALKTVDFYKAKGVVTVAQSVPEMGVWVVKDIDDKVRKPYNFKEVEL